jgi:hypothetical protein
MNRKARSARKLPPVAGRRCQACGGPLESSRGNARYCSNACRQWAMRLRRQSKTVVFREGYMWIERKRDGLETVTQGAK